VVVLSIEFGGSLRGFLSCFFLFIGSSNNYRDNFLNLGLRWVGFGFFTDFLLLAGRVASC
jgi:hypothetical protein